MSASIASVIFALGQGRNDLSLAQFQLDEHNGRVLINANVPYVNIGFLTQLLNIIVSIGANFDISELFCDVLEFTLNVIQLANNNNDEFYEKMAIMIIDSTLNLGADFTTMSDEFNRRGITLVVVAIGEPTYEIWDRYRTLAHNTGGEFMLLQDAPAILERIILSTINGEDTLRQAFYHMGIENHPVMPNYIHEMNEQNQTTDGVGDLAFDNGLSE